MSVIRIVVRERGDESVLLERGSVATLRDVAVACCIDASDCNLGLVTDDGVEVARLPEDLLPVEGDFFFLYGGVDDALLGAFYDRVARARLDAKNSALLDCRDAPVPERLLPAVLKAEARKGSAWDKARTTLQRCE